MRPLKRQPQWPWRRVTARGKRARTTRPRPRRRRTMYGVAGAVAAMALAAGAGWLWRSGAIVAATVKVHETIDGILVGAGMTVENIKVLGLVRADPEGIMDAVNAKVGDSIFALDIGAARRRLRELGWVKTAVVSRLLPDTLVVRIEEREPYAIWQRQGTFALIDREGEVITAENLTRFAGLPLLVGEGARRRAEGIISSLSKEPELFRRVHAVVRVSDRRWNVYFDNGTQARLPAAAPGEAWNRLARLEEQYRLLSRDVEAIDMRLPDRMVLRLSRRAARERREPGKET